MTTWRDIGDVISKVRAEIEAENAQVCSCGHKRGKHELFRPDRCWGGVAVDSFERICSCTGFQAQGVLL